ncbi:uncharacterized protein LOC110737618 [Chenopodium quinoa]|uniref:uncharacterized protein LOC110737618 n=1 Tax=Chenopodium quinoa TaxID=63459 RepID=UPI000B76B9E9|nr:uncharacterized protein LOC110737618 [Chenopodium quinoa]
MVWAIWFCKNKLLFENRSLNANYTATTFVKNVMEYNGYAHKVFNKANMVETGLISRWNCPPARTAKINMDAHLANGYTTIGAAIRNSQGELLVAAVRKFSGDWEVDHAEAAAVRYGLQVARRLGYSSVWVESDSLNVTKRINNNAQGRSLLFLLIDDIYKLFFFLF